MYVLVHVGINGLIGITFCDTRKKKTHFDSRKFTSMQIFGLL